jgi:exonuclease III
LEADAPPPRTVTAPSGLRIIFANVRSLRNKLDEVHLLVERYSPDLLAFTETWLNEDINDWEIQLPGYLLARGDRPERRPGGGVILYWKMHLKTHLLQIM